MRIRTRVPSRIASDLVMYSPFVSLKILVEVESRMAQVTAKSSYVLSIDMSPGRLVSSRSTSRSDTMRRAITKPSYNS
jgi:hypothetical protein